MLFQVSVKGKRFLLRIPNFFGSLVPYLSLIKGTTYKFWSDKKIKTARTLSHSFWPTPLVIISQAKHCSHSSIPVVITTIGHHSNQIVPLLIWRVSLFWNSVQTGLGNNCLVGFTSPESSWCLSFSHVWSLMVGPWLLMLGLSLSTCLCVMLPCQTNSARSVEESFKFGYHSIGSMMPSIVQNYV